MIRRHRPQGSRHASKHWFTSRRFMLDAACVVAGVFILANVGLWVAYHDRTYPRTKIINTNIGSVAFGSLAQKANDLKLLPSSVKLQYGSQSTTASLADLGIRQDTARAVNSAKQQRSWLPIVNLFRSPQLKAPVAINQTTLDAKANEYDKIFHKDPVDAMLQISGTTVGISAAADGYDLNNPQLGNSLLSALDHGQTTATVAVNIRKPGNTVNSLKSAQQDLQQQINTPVTFAYGGRSRQASPDDIAKWYVRSGDGYELSSDAIGSYVANLGIGTFGIHVKDVSSVASQAIAAVKAHKSTTLTLTQQIAVKTMHYCTQLKGVDASNMPALQAKLASTYNDPRGWDLGGLIDFEPATSNCDFTVWLVAPDLMTSFGDICDPVWNCEPGGDNVVLNYARWTTATDAWKAVYPDGNIEDYRAMAINHETGHQLGFGHQVCTPSMAGQLSPVMQQESIDLHGCTFNAWPLPSELAALKSRLGI